MQKTRENQIKENPNLFGVQKKNNTRRQKTYGVENQKIQKLFGDRNTMFRMQQTYGSSKP